MAGPLKSKIQSALARLEHMETTFEVHPDTAKTALENAITLEDTHEAIQEEVQLGQQATEEIATAQNLWADLLRKMTTEEREDADKDFARFCKDQDLLKRIDNAAAQLKKIKALAKQASTNSKLARATADQQARTATQQAAIQLAQAGGAAQAAVTTAHYSLPTLQLRRFAGQKEQWVEFWEGFKTAVHRRPLEKSEKLNYLRNFLDGQARQVIEGLPLTNDNYDVAIKLLKEHYGDEEAYIRLLYGKLNDLRPCRGFEDIKSFAIDLERLARQLEAAGERIDEPSVYIALEKKMTPKILREILKRKAAETTAWTTAKFRKALAQIIQEEEAIQCVIKEANGDRPGRKQHTREERSSPHEVLHTIGAVEEQRQRAKSKPRREGQRQMQQPKQTPKPRIQERSTARKRRPCVFCQKDHWDADCPLPLEKRKAALREKKLCYKCLGAGHFASNCTRRVKCKNCQGAHPTALCIKARPRAEFTAAVHTAEGGKEAELSCFAEKPSDSRRKALLMTTKVTIFNPRDPSRSLVASAFIDSGSQRSFIATAVARQLKLPSISTENCYLAGFGEKEGKAYQSTIVQLGMLTKTGDKLMFPLNSLDFLVRKMPIVDLSEMDSEALQQKKLHIEAPSEPPQLLLGIDVFNELRLSPGEKLPSGFTVSDSKLGKVLSGEGNLASGKRNSLIAISFGNEVSLTGAVYYDSEDGAVDPDYTGDEYDQQPTDSEAERWLKEEKEKDEAKRRAEEANRPIRPPSPLPYGDWTSTDASDDSGLDQNTGNRWIGYRTRKRVRPPAPPVRRPTPPRDRAALNRYLWGDRWPSQPKEDLKEGTSGSSTTKREVRQCKCRCWRSKNGEDSDTEDTRCQCELKRDNSDCLCPKNKAKPPKTHSRCKPPTSDKGDASSDEDSDNNGTFLASAVMKSSRAKTQRNAATKAETAPGQKGSGHNMQLSNEPSSDQSLDECLAQFFGLQVVGMNDSLDPSENDEVLKQFKANLVFAEGRYQVGLPWNQRVSELPTNYKQAKARLRSTLKQLKQNPEHLKQYQAILNDQLDRGIIEIVEDPAKAEGPVHYLPHRAVIREDKNTTKVRIVMDGSARPKAVKGAPSLNDCLQTGPLLLKDLTGILLRWRQMPIVILADIEKAFLMIGVRPSDRDATRFLWVDNAQEVNEDNILYEHCTVFRFTRVSFGLNASPFLLNATIQQHLEFFDSELARKIQENIYVDNVIIGTTEDTDLMKICKEAQDIFTAAGMHLREFITNAPEGLDALNNEDKAKETKQVKVLGVQWTLENDAIEIKFPHFEGIITKRTTLAALARVFDPQGLISPALLAGKLFLQKLWSIEKKWDEPLSQELQEEWIKLMEDWTSNNKPVQVNFQRYIGTPEEMHTFADASGNAMGIAVYWKASEASSHLVYAKSLVKPVKLPDKAGTIPKLELQALAIATKVTMFVRDQIKMPDNKITLWSDSKCCIDQLKVAHKQDRFVENRLRKIRGKWPVNHVSSEDNPADLASRGARPLELDNSSLWKHGPAWLDKHPENWPAILVSYAPGEELQVTDNDEEITHEMAMPIALKEDYASLVDVYRFSSWIRMQRSTGYVFRFIRHTATTKQLGSEVGKQLLPQQGEVTQEEMWLAEKFLIIEAQKRRPPSKEQTQQLRLYEENGILRCQGRIDEAAVEPEVKRPIFLPKQDRATHLIIINLHRHHKHCGRGNLLAIIRQTFWIPQGRRTVDWVIFHSDLKCLNCLKFKLKPFQKPEEATLPAIRTHPARPFDRTGVDYFGPLRIRKGEENPKIWVSLFTCMVTRSIHLEMASDLSAESFLRCYRRFVARRGTPSIVMSDNGTQFVLASKTIAEIWSDAKQQATNTGTRWSLIPPRTPEYGGFWEKMVGITKNSLKRTVGRALLPLDELTTLLCEIEATINCRPLMFQSDKEPSRVIRPVDFLIPYANKTPTLPQMGAAEAEWVPTNARRDVLKATLEHAANRIDKFWQIWIEDYLIALRERVTKRKNGIGREPMINERVLVEEEEMPRNHWQLGRIAELRRGRDGRIRTVKLIMQGKTFERPINRIYPLEMDIDQPKNAVHVHSLLQMFDPYADSEDESGYIPMKTSTAQEVEKMRMTETQQEKEAAEAHRAQFAAAREKREAEKERQRQMKRKGRTQPQKALAVSVQSSLPLPTPSLASYPAEQQRNVQKEEKEKAKKKKEEDSKKEKAGREKEEERQMRKLYEEQLQREVEELHEEERQRELKKQQEEQRRQLTNGQQSLVKLTKQPAREKANNADTTKRRPSPNPPRRMRSRSPLRRNKSPRQHTTNGREKRHELRRSPPRRKHNNSPLRKRRSRSPIRRNRSRSPHRSKPRQSPVRAELVNRWPAIDPPPTTRRDHALEERNVWLCHGQERQKQQLRLNLCSISSGSGIPLGELGGPTHKLYRQYQRLAKTRIVCLIRGFIINFLIRHQANPDRSPEELYDACSRDDPIELAWAFFNEFQRQDALFGWRVKDTLFIMQKWLSNCVTSYEEIAHANPIAVHLTPLAASNDQAFDSWIACLEHAASSALSTIIQKQKTTTTRYLNATEVLVIGDQSASFAKSEDSTVFDDMTMDALPTWDAFIGPKVSHVILSFNEEDQMEEKMEQTLSTISTPRVSFLLHYRRPTQNNIIKWKEVARKHHADLIWTSGQPRGIKESLRMLGLQPADGRNANQLAPRPNKRTMWIKWAATAMLIMTIVFLSAVPAATALVPGGAIPAIQNIANILLNPHQEQQTRATTKWPTTALQTPRRRTARRYIVRRTRTTTTTETAPTTTGILSEQRLVAYIGPQHPVWADPTQPETTTTKRPATTTKRPTTTTRRQQPSTTRQQITTTQAPFWTKKPTPTKAKQLVVPTTKQRPQQAGEQRKRQPTTSTMPTTEPPLEDYDYPDPELPRAEALISMDYAASKLGKLHEDSEKWALPGESDSWSGTPAYWCSNEGSTILQIKSQEADPFCREAPSFFSKWTNMSLTIYTRIKDPVPVKKAYLCSVKSEKDSFYTNLLGDKFLDPHIQFLPITAEDCRRMTTELMCKNGGIDQKEQKMTVQTDHFWSTTNKAKIEFPGNIASLWKGEQSVEVINCAVQSASLFYRPHNLEMVSPLYNVRHCRWQTESCKLEDNTTLIWDADCQNTSCSGCDYEKMKDWQGEFTAATEDTPTTWLSADRELALTFDANPARAKGCDGLNLRISDQGYGIPKEHFQEMTRTRTKRDVRESQLAGGLTASQIHTARAIQQLFQRECRRTNRAENPTLLARKLLNKDTIQARWLTENELEVWSCIQVPFGQVDFRNTDKCYRFIPVTVRFPEKQLKIDAFLDPVLRIISATSAEADCLHYRYHLIEKRPGFWVRIDAQKGRLFAVPPSSIYQVYETIPDKAGGVLDLKPLVFHEMILTNSSDIFPHVDELLRFQNWKSKVEQERTSKASTLGALPYGIKGLAWAWLDSYWEMIKDHWFTVACAYASFLLIRDLIAPILLTYLFNPLIKGIQHLKPIGWPPGPQSQRSKRKRRRQPQREEQGQWEELRQINYPPFVIQSGMLPQTSAAALLPTGHSSLSVIDEPRRRMSSMSTEEEPGEMRDRSNTEGPFARKARPRQSRVRIKEMDD